MRRWSGNLSPVVLVMSFKDGFAVGSWPEFEAREGKVGCGGGCEGVVDVTSVAENGRIESQSQSLSAYPFASAFSTNASHIIGLLFRSTLERPIPNPPNLPGEGGIHVPLRMASSTIRR